LKERFVERIYISLAALRCSYLPFSAGYVRFTHSTFEVLQIRCCS